MNILKSLVRLLAGPSHVTDRPPHLPTWPTPWSVDAPKRDDRVLWTDGRKVYASLYQHILFPPAPYNLVNEMPPPELLLVKIHHPDGTVDRFYATPKVMESLASLAGQDVDKYSENAR